MTGAMTKKRKVPGKIESDAGWRGREEARERGLTGFDAPISDAAVGDAGNGASPFGADLTGLEQTEDGTPERSLEPDPDHTEDILPDQIQRGAADQEEG